MNFKSLGKVDFPDSKLYNINMMPFIMNDPHSLPAMLRGYWSLITACNVERSEVGYLTVRENFVAPGATQSRAGVHTDGWGDKRWSNDNSTSWGKGQHNSLSEGIFIASTVKNTTEVWDMQTSDSKKYGDCEHLNLQNGIMLDANELVWMTDRTPHRCVPVNKPVFRQFFRLVTEDISVWYALHNTANPLGVKARNISYENKFAVSKELY